MRSLRRGSPESSGQPESHSNLLTMFHTTIRCPPGDPRKTGSQPRCTFWFVTTTREDSRSCSTLPIVIEPGSDRWGVPASRMQSVGTLHWPPDLKVSSRPDADCGPDVGGESNHPERACTPLPHNHPQYAASDWLIAVPSFRRRVGTTGLGVLDEADGNAKAPSSQLSETVVRRP